jgi:hypothetical protein
MAKEIESDDIDETEAEDKPLDRKAMLLQQFEEADSDEPAPATAERDERGKFAKKESNEEASEGEEEALWKRPPSSWKKEYHEAWQSADPRLQQYAWQREEEMRRGIEPLKSKAAFADEINEVLDPYLPTIRQLGINPSKAIEGLLRADYTLRSSPPEVRRAYFMQLANAYGIDVGNGAAMPKGQQQAAVDPNFYLLQNELQNIRGEVSSWKQQQERAMDEAILSEINDFASKAEHFEDVRPAMIQLLQSGVAETLQQAYDKAIRLDDQLFESIQSRRQAEVDARKRASADKAAKTAKAAAVSVKSSTPGTQPKAKAQDRRSMLLEQFSDLSERF